MEKWNGKLWDGDGGGMKVGQNDISYLRRVVGHFFSPLMATLSGRLRSASPRMGRGGSLVKD